MATESGGWFDPSSAITPRARRFIAVRVPDRTVVSTCATHPGALVVYNARPWSWRSVNEVRVEWAPRDGSADNDCVECSRSWSEQVRDQVVSGVLPRSVAIPLPPRRRAQTWPLACNVCGRDGCGNCADR